MANQLRTQPRGARYAHEHHGEVQDFLQRYAKALVEGDDETVAQLWEVPAFVIGAETAMAVTRRDEIATFFGRAKEAYHAQGVTETWPDILDEEWLGDRTVVVSVRWPYLDADGHEIGAERAEYTLRRDDRGALRIRYVLIRGVEGTGDGRPS